MILAPQRSPTSRIEHRDRRVVGEQLVRGEDVRRSRLAQLRLRQRLRVTCLI
jgi:hypothetical protein